MYKETLHWVAEDETPGEGEFQIGYLELFKSLPPELFFIIISSDDYLINLSIRVNKQMNVEFFPLFYARIGLTPIPKHEIYLGVLKRDLTLIEKYSDKHISMKTCGNFDSADGDELVDIKYVEECIFNLPYVSCHCLDNYATEWMYIESSLDITLEMFCHFSLLRDRKSCVFYDPRYAFDMLERECERLTRDLPVVLCLKDFQRVFTVVYMGCEDAGLRALDGNFDWTNQKSWRDEISSYFEKCRTAIREKVAEILSREDWEI